MPLGRSTFALALLPETERAQVRDPLKKRWLTCGYSSTRRGAGTVCGPDQRGHGSSCRASFGLRFRQRQIRIQIVIRALTVAGMNDVLNSQGYTQAAWWNRIPGAAWALMFAIALFCNLLLGYGARKMEPKLLMILPVVVAVAFFLIADIDSPRGGLIRVVSFLAQIRGKARTFLLRVVPMSTSAGMPVSPDD